MRTCNLHTTARHQSNPLSHHATADTWFYKINNFLTLILFPPIFQPLVSLTAACAYSILLYRIKAIPFSLSNTTWRKHKQNHTSEPRNKYNGDSVDQGVIDIYSSTSMEMHQAKECFDYLDYMSISTEVACEVLFCDIRRQAI